ncbi:hypothetical protein QBC34DRAFT_458067, partial [Podospora aff. communis PSN243]
TVGEQTAIFWAVLHTDLPVPEVYTCEPVRKGDLGLEYIIMKRMPGSSYQDHWPRSWNHVEEGSGEKRWRQAIAAKKKVARLLAKFHADTFRRQYDYIGSLEHSSGEGYKIGRLVSPSLCWTLFVDPAVSPGPFKGSREWMKAELACAWHDCQRRLASTRDHEASEQASTDTMQSGGPVLDSGRETFHIDNPDNMERTSRVLSGLRRHFDEFFPCPDPSDPPEPTILCRRIRGDDVLINPVDGEVTAVVDWEYVCALPLWAACRVPEIFPVPNKERAKRPKQDDFLKSDIASWVRIEEYGETRLRSTFLDEMRNLCPDWIEHHESHDARKDFKYALDNRHN